MDQNKHKEPSRKSLYIGKCHYGMQGNDAGSIQMQLVMLKSSSQPIYYQSKYVGRYSFLWFGLLAGIIGYNTTTRQDKRAQCYFRGAMNLAANQLHIFISQLWFKFNLSKEMKRSSGVFFRTSKF